MPLLSREPLIAAIVLGCIAVGVLGATLTFCLVRLRQQLRRKREAAVSLENLRQNSSLGKL